MSPRNFDVSSRKRRLDGDGELDDWPNAKRRALEAVASLTSFSVSTQKSSQEDPMDTWEDPDDFCQPQAKRPAKNRMKLHMALQSCKTWESCCEILNIMPKDKSVALVVNDLPQWARLKALSQLDELGGQLYSRVVKDISEFQMDKSRYDPKSLFPCVATNQFVETLPDSARSCNICGEGFKEGATIVWKLCGKHSLHEQCLRESLNDSYMPLVGPCSCILED